MTEQEAIEGLKRMRIGMFNGKIDGEPMMPYFNVAIEALEKQINDRWIPVTEKLPETNKPVQITFREYIEYSKKYRYGVCKAVYVPEHHIKTDDMWSYCDNDELSIYDESEDEFYVKSGWYEVIEHGEEYSNIYISCDITAWKPLPEPYKELQSS